MRPAELEKYLYDHIPVSMSMGVAVVSVEADAVILRAPLGPNINHRHTAFGGSVSALAILAAWSLLHTGLRSEGVDCRLVIQRNSMEYLRPIHGDFVARAFLADSSKWSHFIDMVRQKGKGRISASALLEHNGELVGRFLGDFVALGAKG